jgi:hypothetical protein
MPDVDTGEPSMNVYRKSKHSIRRYALGTHESEHPWVAQELSNRRTENRGGLGGSQTGVSR